MSTKRVKKPTVSKKKPAVVADVTPDGIRGILPEQRPLIAHLPIFSKDMEDTMMFEGAETIVGGGAMGETPIPFDMAESFAAFRQQSTLQIHSAPTRETVPVNYSEVLMTRFQDANRDRKLPTSTDIACFWDCHVFSGKPVAIPIEIKDDIWYVYGNFCCPSCAASYIFSERLESHVQWERFALLNDLVGGSDPVRLAPPRSSLRLFGGPFDITQYRAIVQEQKLRVDTTLPPMISISQVLDTKLIDLYDASIRSSLIPAEMDRLNRPGAQGLRLRRSKPALKSENTLEVCMGITTTSS